MIRSSNAEGRDLEIYRGGGELDLPAVERALQALWKRASAEHAGEGRPPVTRVGTLNLLALAEESTAAESALGEMLEISAHHPGRIFLLETTPEPGALRAEVSAHCHLRGGGGQVCSEIIRVRIGEPVEPRVHSVVAPLLIPDLPVVLWLPGDPRHADPAENLLRLVDRVVVDSHRAAARAAHFARLRRWDQTARLGLTDLAWQRLGRWRSLAAQLFQEELAVSSPADLREIEIEYVDAEEGRPCGRIEALYFAAWVAARLGYAPASERFEPERGLAWEATRADGTSLSARFRPRSRAGEVAGDLHRIGLTAASGTVYEITRGSEYCTALLCASSGQAPVVAANVDLRSRSRIEVLRASLEERRPDPVLAEALEWLLAAMHGTG